MEDNREEIIEEVSRIVKDAMETKAHQCTWYYRLGCNNGNRWAIVIAWMDYNGTNEWELFGKVAYQPTNSLMQEYDIDWIMPYSEITGEVYDTEITIQDDSSVEYLVDTWMKMKDIYPYAYYEVIFGSGFYECYRYVLKVDEDTTDYRALVDVLIDYLVEKEHPSILDKNEYFYNANEDAYVHILDHREIIYSDEYVEGGNCGDVLLHHGDFRINKISAMDIGDDEVVEVA